MAIFDSLTNTLKALAIGERVKVTLRPETGRFPNPMEGHITQKDESRNFSLKSDHGVVQVRASDILAITRLQRSPKPLRNPAPSGNRRDLHGPRIRANRPQAKDAIGSASRSDRYCNNFSRSISPELGHPL
jgi:hypothetical protein